MRVRLKNKILLWKTNALGRTIYLRTLQAQLKRRDLRIANLELEVVRLKQITQPVVVANHTYPAQLIALAVFIVVQGNGSLRCAAKAVAFVSQIMGWNYAQPSHTTVRRWVLRCGLHLLENSKAMGGSYVGIIDESIQVGKEKLLLFLGVRLSENHSHAVPLTMADTVVLGMGVQKSWNGQEIADFIAQRLAHHQGIQIKYMINDQGKNLLAALRILNIAHVSDCSHILMNAVKKLFSKDKALRELCSRISQLRQRYLLSDWGFLLPTRLREKDRFLHIFTLLDWVDRIDGYWNKLSATQRRPLAFLKLSKPLLRCLEQVRDIIAMTAQLVKSAGLSPTSRQLWETKLSQYHKGKRMTKQASDLVQYIRTYFDQHQQLILDHQRLLCCSDIIESTFGHYKNKGGMAVISGDVLGITLLCQPITCSFIQQALTTVHWQDIERWQQRFICDNRYSLLRRMNRELKTVA